jgi:hypothetical protein
MSTKPMPMQLGGGYDDQGDPGDMNDAKWQQCEQDIEDLEARVSALEQKAGIVSPADEAEDPLKAAIRNTKGALGS